MAKAPPSLLEHAITAVENVHALTVGLAHAGANPDVLKQLGQCSALLTQVVKALGSGPSLDGASGGAPSGGSPAPQPGEPDADDAGPGGPAPAGPPQAAAAPAPNPAAHHSMKAASSALQAAMAATGKGK